MNQDIERLLNQVTPRALPPALRERVLTAVDEELQAARLGEASLALPSPRWRSRPGLAAAAVLLASLLLNHVVNTAVDRRLEAVLGPRPVPRQAAEIAADIAAQTDIQTGRWAFDRLVSHRGEEGNTRIYFLRLKLMVDELAAEIQEPFHEARQGNTQVDRDHRSDRDRQPAGAQRILRLEYRNTA